ncbi:MAG TPA: alpha/beta hydrolase-fold protein [Anaeromyxobacter sp.]|nr:alpha/beta hydrolase-fold protein [Anaeromyxobacter sp.]
MIPPPRLRALAVALALAACAAGPAAARDATPPAAPAAAAAHALRDAARGARAHGQGVFSFRFASPALADNVQGNPPEARGVVRLPAAVERCRAGAEDCWLVLYLPGFDGEPARAIELLAPRLAALERAGDAPPVVLVAVDGRTRLGGGFYVDSPASGRFAGTILDGILPALRTALDLELPPARTLVTGHSMGGFGALWLALQRPDEFSGAAAFNPAARLVPLAERLLGSVESARGAAALDPAELVRRPDPDRFRERLLAAMCAAFVPAPSRPGGFAVPFDPAARPHALAPQARAGLSRFDLGRPLEGALARGARALPRIVVTGGGRDRLIPPSDVQAVAEALSAARGPGRAVELSVRPDGDHGSQLADDFAAAIRSLAGRRR